MLRSTKTLTALGMLCALAYIVVCAFRIPIVLFLKYDPKDVVIVIGGFLFGPLSALLISAVVSLLEMLTISDTGPIGLIMNVLSTAAFACTASLVYQMRHTLRGAVVALLLGGLMMTAVMMLWNFLITPLYMGFPREAVVELLLPAFLPFNLLKAGLNATVTLLLYKPVVTVLRRAGLVEPSVRKVETSKRPTGVMLLSAASLVTLVILALVMKGVL